MRILCKYIKKCIFFLDFSTKIIAKENFVVIVRHIQRSAKIPAMDSTKRYSHCWDFC